MAEPFFMQWQITDACQLTCRHCYRDARRDDLSLDDLAVIFDRFLRFIRRHRLPGRINFGGGEPLLRKHELLYLIAKSRECRIHPWVLTNGLLIDDAVAGELKEHGCEAVQISLDGDRDVHDWVRGNGTFDRALPAVQRLRAVEMPVTLSMTVARWNQHCLDELASYARDLGTRLFVSRFVPCGSGGEYRDGVLSAEEWRDVAFRCLGLTKSGLAVALRDPHFACLVSETHADCRSVGGCAVGYRGFSVESNGDVYPCRRLPIVVGNLLKTSLQAIWNSPLMGKLRDRDSLSGRCGTCTQRRQCGGCRALAFALNDDPMGEDPQCFRKPSGRTRVLSSIKHVLSMRS